MCNKLSITLLLLFFPLGFTQSQDKKAFKSDFYEAEYFFLNEHYEESAFLYQQLLRTDTSNYNLHFLLGASYLSSQNNKTRAIPYLEKAVANMSPGYREGSWKERDAPREALFALAKAYHVTNRFDEAIEYYKKYKNVMGTSDPMESEYVQQQIKSVELARRAIKDTVKMDYLSLGDGFQENCYRAVLAEKDSTMVFMTDRPFYSPILMTKRVNGKWTEPEILNDKLKIDGNYTLCSISYDGTELYLAVEEDFNWDIYISYFENGKWSPIQPLDKTINSEFNETHASISHDKRRLYFTSDRPGGLGAKDIYYSDRNPDAGWQKPINIGKPVNTIFSEETPFESADGDKLYFSSKGHETMGGFDIYYSTRLADNQWSSPVSPGYPLNTADDDLFLVPLENSNYALYTPTSGLLPQNTLLAINILPEIAGTPEEKIEPDVKKEVELPENIISGNALTQNARPLTMENDATKSEESQGEWSANDKDRTEPLQENIAGLEADNRQSRGALQLILAEEMPENADSLSIATTGYSADHDNEGFILQELTGKNFILSGTILFEFESYRLTGPAMVKLDKFCSLMQEKPDLKLEIAGYTDSKGPSDYNLRLSRKRSTEVMNYLVKRGVNRENLLTLAMGESNFIAINTNPDGSDNPEGRKYNRRAEISLLNNIDESIVVEPIHIPEYLRFIYPGKISEESGSFIASSENIVSPSHSSAHGKGTQVYTIQLLAMRNPVREGFFESSERVIRVQGVDGLHRYITGEYSSIKEAVANLGHYTELGFADAFVRAVP